MSSKHKNSISNDFESSKQGIDFKPISPRRIMLYFAIGSLTMLFLGLTFGYLFSKPNWRWSQFRFPKVFLISTLVLVASSFTIHRSIGAYVRDDSTKLLQFLSYTFALSILFVIFQVLGWTSLISQGIYLNGKPDGSYLYLISGLHALHVLAGLVILAYIYYKTKKRLQDPVENLLYYTDPKQKTTLELIALYWHFVDILWIYLLFFFLFNHL